MSAVLAAAPAKATPLLAINYGTTAQSDTLGSGSIVVTLASGAFKNSTFAASGYPFAGSDSEPQIDLGARLKVSGPGTLVFQITQTGNINAGHNWVFDSEFSDIINSPGLTISYASYLGTNAFQKGTPLSSQAFTQTGSLSDLSNETLAPGEFSITEVITITATRASTLISNFDASLSGVDPVPEPASLALLGGGLISLGALRRRKLRQA